MDDPAHLQALLDHAQDKLVVVDESGTYRYANGAVERILGYTPAELVGTDAFEQMHPADRDRVAEQFEALVASETETADTAEYRHRTADGDWVWLESRMSNGVVAELGGYVVSSRDVTDRRRAEERERRSTTRLQEIATNARDVLWMFSGDWSELLFINGAYETVWGQPVARLQEDPQHFLEGVHPADRDRVLEAMERLSGGESLDLEYRVNPTREYRRWVWVKAQPVLEDGEVVRIVGFARDITDRRRRERQLRVMDNLLRHNLRNDMNVVLGHAALARDRTDDDEVAESMEVVLETGLDLLETAAKEREIIDVLVGIDDRKRLDVVDVVGRAVETFRSGNPTATVTVESPARLDAVALPEIRRVFDELLENAAEYARTEPVIDVEISEREDRVVVEIGDNAPAIPSNEIEPLFGEGEPDEIYHGTGLGLWLVYWVVDLSDGDIEFSCPDEDGNVVTISLPRAVE